MNLYPNLPALCAPLDERNTRYQFNLDKDIPWDRVDAPGVYFPESFLSDLGIQVGLMPAGTPTRALFEWAFALATLQLFTAFEEDIVSFVDGEKRRELRSTSAANFALEEAKHIVMFQRASAAMRAQRPEVLADYDALYAKNKGTLAQVRREDWPDEASFHFINWTAFVYVEEYSVYLHERLRAEPKGIQPTWMEIHRCHYQEELQHLVTDEVHLDTLRIDEARRLELSKLYVAAMLSNFGQGFKIALALVARVTGEPKLAKLTSAVTRTRYWKHVLTGRSFRRTRKYVPFLQDLAEGRI
jgi:hypothetical protein